MDGGISTPRTACVRCAMFEIEYDRALKDIATLTAERDEYKAKYEDAAADMMDECNEKIEVQQDRKKIRDERDALQEHLKAYRLCGTCDGTGVMSVVVDELPPDGRAVMEDATCGECHGTGIGWYSQIIAERGALAARVRALEQIATDNLEDARHWAARCEELEDDLAQARNAASNAH